MKKYIQWCLLLTLFISVNNAIYGHGTHTIKITITDKKTHDLLYGANVQWLNSSIGATSDEMGIAELDLVDILPALVEISYVGYQTDTIKITKEADLKIQLIPMVALNEVQVKAKRQTSFISSMDPMKTEKLEAGELKKAACCNLSESFQTNASAEVNFSDAVTGAKEIRLLGLSGIYVQNLLEGVPFMRGLTSTFGLDHVPAPWMKSISISKGVPSVKNSYEGISGSMNVDFKSTFNDSAKLYFDMFGNQQARIETNLLIHHKIKPTLGTSLMLNGAFMPMKEDFNHDGFLDQPLIKQYNLLNRWNYHTDKIEGDYMIKVLSENRTAGQIKSNDDSIPFYKINIKTKRVEAFAKTGYIINNKSSLGTQFSGVYHQQKSQYGNKDFNTQQGSFTGTFLYQTTLKNDFHTLVTGANFVYDDLKEDLDTLQIKHRDVVPGIFAEYTFNWNKKIAIVAGLRGDYHSRIGFKINPRIHARFTLAENTTLRIAAGSGFRAPNVLSENQSLLASSRRIVFQENPVQEYGWNYGISLVQKFHLFNREGSFSVDFFRTDFLKQAIIDIDGANNTATVSNLHGKSFSNSLLIEFNFEALKGLDIKTAYRLEDVRATYHGVLMQKPLQALNKGLVALSYRTPNQQWQFDVNLSINGRRRMSNSFSDYNAKIYSPRYVLLNAQILKYFKHAEFFIGAENMTNYRQKNPILGVPNTTYFDTYQVYAPITGANFYGGFRVFIQ